jgi:hypothetical protein
MVGNELVEIASATLNKLSLTGSSWCCKTLRFGDAIDEATSNATFISKRCSTLDDGHRLPSHYRG